MSSLAFLWPLAACVVTGAGLYVTRGVLDQVITATGAMRIALLPPWQALLGFVCMAALLLVGIDHLNAPRGTTAGNRPRLRDLALPLLAPAALLIPYLPVLPDRWPVLQILAGPLRYVIWLVIVAQLLWVLWQTRLLTARWIERWSIGRVAVAIGLGTALVSGAAAMRLTGTPMFPGGDEPHYLVIAQSLWRDGDLKIENNHKRGDYREYYNLELDPHYLTRGADGEIYSVHPVGLPVLLTPVYGLGGYYAVVCVLILFASVASALAWWWTVGLLNSPGAATFAWAAIAGTAPFLFNTFTVYPEIAAGLAVVVAMVLITKTNAALSGPGRWAAIGVACATLPWFSTKYAPMSAALMLVALARTAKSPTAFSLPASLRSANVWALVLPYGASLLAWFAFFYAYWGSPWPQSPYGALTQTTPSNLLLGGPGLIFDQEYGLLAYAPAYILAATGLWTMWRGGGELRRQAVEIIIVFGALLATVGAFGIWWGGTAAPARPIASGLLLLMLPIAVAFRSAPAGSPGRAGQHLLLWVGVGIAVTLAFAQEGSLMNNDRDGTSALLEWWLPRWDTWTLAPSFTRRDLSDALVQTAVWLAVAGGAAALLSRWRLTRPGAAALAACGTFAAALGVVIVVMPWFPGPVNAHPRDLRGRARVAALDAYDARALPAAVIYDPLRKTAAAETIPLLTMEVEPGLRTDPQPLRVIHNGRFSLPAGRYDIAVTFGDRVPSRAESLGLQVGRMGPPFATWSLRPNAGERWQTTLDLPVDASFIGLRGSNEMERAIASIVITPTTVVDAGARPRLPTVLSAATYDGVGMFLQDGPMYPEAAGFWTTGGRSSLVTVSPRAGRTTPVVLTVHSGAKPNRVTFSTHGWQQTLELVPGVVKAVTLPMPATGVIPVTIWTENGFSPTEIDPASRDPRFLGVWIEVAKEP